MKNKKIGLYFQNKNLQYMLVSSKNVFEPDPNPKNSQKGPKNAKKGPNMAKLKTKRKHFTLTTKIDSLN